MNKLKPTVYGIAAAILITAAGLYYYTQPNIGRLAPNLSARSGDASSSGEFQNAQRAVEYYREAIRNHPDDPKHYVELAQLYVQEARVTALHHEYFPRAEVLLKRALELDPANFDALITTASMYVTLHKFEEAVPLVKRALAINPYSAFAYGVLLDTHVELGEYDAAVKACDAMLALRPDLRSYARASYLRELHGDVSGAIQAMHMAAEAGIAGQESRAWALYNLGKLYLTAGKPDTAAFIFKGILEERPGYVYAWAGLAFIHASRNDFAQAISLLEAAYKSTPDHGFLETLAGLYAANGQVSKARETIHLVLREFADHQDEGWNIDKEYALFCANHGLNLAEALQRAEREYHRRPENIEVLDVYAWVLFKSGRVPDAVEYAERALRLGTQNVEMLLRASTIYEKAGNNRKAQELLERTRGNITLFSPLPAHDNNGLLQPRTETEMN